MKRLIYNGNEYVLSRVRDGKCELVNVMSGELLVTSEHEITPLISTVSQYHVGVLATITPFAQRPRTFLDELRQRRRTLLEEHKKERARNLSKAHSRTRKGKVKLTDMELLMAQFGLNGTKK